MRKILVAGAGHGGLTAAVNLARNGYAVTVIESKNRDDMGHDWHDCLNLSAFDMAEIARPDKSMYHKGTTMGFKSPSREVEVEFDANPEAIFMDRKFLIEHLLKCAEEAGVKLIFGQKVIAPIVKGNIVKGLNIADENREYAVEADLVIDAAGMHSPVRTNLPIACGVKREIAARDVFHVYRAYYNNKTGVTVSPPYCVVPFNKNRPGIDWTWATKDYVDILVGKFGIAGELTQEEIDEAVASLKSDYPFIGDEIIRGGTVNDIPLSKMLPIIVCNGYAAVGDSAGMTIPINGSGIVLSMKAGKILADTVMSADGVYTKKALWKYEYEYFKSLGKDLVMISVLKNMCTYIDNELVDYFFREKVMTPNVLVLADGQDVNITVEYICNALVAAAPKFKKLAPIIKNSTTIPLVPFIINSIPKEYDADKVRAWACKYDAL